MNSTYNYYINIWFVEPFVRTFKGYLPKWGNGTESEIILFESTLVEFATLCVRQRQRKGNRKLSNPESKYDCYIKFVMTQSWWRSPVTSILLDHLVTYFFGPQFFIFFYAVFFLVICHEKYWKTQEIVYFLVDPNKKNHAPLNWTTN